MYLAAMSSTCFFTRAMKARRLRWRSSSSVAWRRRRKSSRGNFASTGTRPWPRRTTASTRSPLEGVLQGVVLDRQHLRKEIGEPELTQPAAELRGAEDVLEARHVASHLVDARRRLAELAEAPLHLADDLRRVVETRAKSSL